MNGALIIGLPRLFVISLLRYVIINTSYDSDLKIISYFFFLLRITQIYVFLNYSAIYKLHK